MSICKSCCPVHVVLDKDPKHVQTVSSDNKPLFRFKKDDWSVSKSLYLLWECPCAYTCCPVSWLLKTSALVRYNSDSHNCILKANVFISVPNGHTLGIARSLASWRVKQWIVQMGIMVHNFGHIHMCNLKSCSCVIEAGAETRRVPLEMWNIGLQPCQTVDDWLVGLWKPRPNHFFSTSSQNTPVTRELLCFYRQGEWGSK